MFPSDYIWNVRIDKLPVDPAGVAYINSEGGSAIPLHPDFGTVWNGAPNGWPITIAPANQPPVPIVYTLYGNESDPGPYPIPPNALIEGGPTSTGDRHVLVLQSGTCKLYELFAAYPQTDGSWQAGSGAIFDLTKDGPLRPAGWTSTDAAGLPIIPGLVRYDEVQQAIAGDGVLHHALRFTVANSRTAYIWPARHFASYSNNPAFTPMGQRFRLKQGLSTSIYPNTNIPISAINQVILNTLQQYGMFVADNGGPGGSFFVSGVPDPRWNDADLHDLGLYKATDFEAVDESSLQVDPNSGQARTSTPAAAAYLGTDTNTQGNWTGQYGSGGFMIANDASNVMPAYATVSLTGSAPWSWASSTSDRRALQTASGATTRIASTFYSTSNTFNIGLNLTDGQTHRVALYLLDWDTTSRAETISVLDAGTNAVLDTETYSTFQNGKYAVWNLTGNVIIQVTRTGGINSVVAGVFFDAASSTTPTTASASYIGADATTQGAWTTKYGADGDLIANYATNPPSYAAVNLTSNGVWTWAKPTTDPRALTATGGNIASTYYGSTFTINVSVTDGNTHQLSLYLLDWDTTTRAETISILDATTKTVLDKETFANFHNGVYASWNIGGNVVVQITDTGGTNAVVSGIFFGPAPVVVPTTASATYSGLDKNTLGTWTGKYGASGYLIANDGNALPAFATISLTGNGTWTWISPTADTRALQTASGSAARIASTFYSTAKSFNINLNLTDGKTHRIGLYLLDWDTTARAETITIIDAASNAVLNTQSFASFQNGQYASWNVTGNVIIQVANTAGINAVVSGIFID